MYAFKKWSHLRFYFSGMWDIIVPSAILSIWATHAFRSRLVRIPPLLSSPSHLRLSDTLFLLLSALRGASCTPVVAGAFRIASLFTSLPPEGSRLLQGQDLASSISLSSIEVFFLKKKKKKCIYLAAPGLSCSTQDLQSLLYHAESSVAAHSIFSFGMRSLNCGTWGLVP